MRKIVQRKEKKICNEDHAQLHECSLPDGESLLVIQHFLSQFDEHSFPDKWGDGELFGWYY